MLRYYIKYILNANHIKPKVMKLIYAIKISFNINGTFDALPSHGGETQVRVSQSQVAESRLGSTLPASNSRKG